MEILVCPLNFYSEMLELLSPDGYISKNQSSYIYRGQAKDWELVPTIFRDNNKNLVYHHSSDIKSMTYDLHGDREVAYRYVEHHLLKDFYDNANRNGLSLPPSPFDSGEYIVSHKVMNYFEVQKEEWLPSNLASVAALAQHYGIPTRLLDWTFDINVALYFASIGAVKMFLKNGGFEKDAKLVIWLLSANDLELSKVFNDSLPLKFVVPNYKSNPNICAQKGILTYWSSPAAELTNQVCKEPLNKLISGFNSVEDMPPAMIKYTLPVTESLTIAKHLSNNGYNAATMFPGYYGVTQKIYEDLVIEQAEQLYNKLEELDKLEINIELNSEQKCLTLFNSLTAVDQLRVIERMETMRDSYMPEFNESAL